MQFLRVAPVIIQFVETKTWPHKGNDMQALSSISKKDND